MARVIIIISMTVALASAVGNDPVKTEGGSHGEDQCALLQGKVQVAPTDGKSAVLHTNSGSSGQKVMYQPQALPFDPVPCRDDFASLAEKRFKKTGVAVEVGVNTGAFSAKNLKLWQGKYFMVDAWHFRPGDPGDKNYKSDALNLQNMHTAANVTKFADSRRTLVRALSVEAAKTFKDSSIDWIYLDALHTREAMLHDLAAWYPKLRPGGLLTGDDYGDARDTQMFTADRWAKTYSDVARKPEHDWGVVSALHEFVQKQGLDLHTTWMNDCYAYNAWYVVKPGELRA